MARPLVQIPDPEVPAVDLADQLLDAFGEPDVTVGVALPADYVFDESPPHVQVACDGFPTDELPVYADATLRFTVHAATTGEAKRLAHLLVGLLTARGSSAPFSRIRRLVGPQPARDPDTRAEMAWFTVRATVRTTPIVATGS